MDHRSPKLKTTITFAIARDAPVGVVIAAYNSRLSRVFHWDLTNDTFTPGQFLKARAYVLSISADGRYFGYHVHASHKREQTYACVARLAHFTALGFFPYYVFYMWNSSYRPIIQFLENGDIFVLAERANLPWEKDFHLVQERVSPGFKHKIIRSWNEMTPKLLDQILERLGLRSHNHWDNQVNGRRRFFTKSNGLHSVDKLTGIQDLLAEFPKLPFEEIEPPDWAKEW